MFPIRLTESVWDIIWDKWKQVVLLRLVPVIPIFIDRIQDRRGKTIFNAVKRKCMGCEEISYLKEEIHKEFI